jgi:hypothetical protein
VIGGKLGPIVPKGAAWRSYRGDANREEVMFVGRDVEQLLKEFLVPPFSQIFVAIDIAI